MCRFVIYLKSKHLRHFKVNSLLIPFIGNFYSTRFKFELFGKQYSQLLTVNKRCVLYILAKRFRSQTVSLRFLRILLNKRYNMLNNTKIYDDIATYEVSVCAWRNWRSAIVGVLAVVIFGKKLVLKARLWYHVKLFDIWIPNNWQLVKNWGQNYCETLLRNSAVAQR